MELAEVAKRANAKTVVLTHITEQMDVPGVRERVLIEMARVYPGNLIWGEDLLEVPLGAPEPARLE
jgi:ribonuclease Z